MLGLVKSGLDR